MKDIRKIKLKKGNIIPLKYDFMFIQIFNNERNMDIIESFLSAYFCMDLEKIKGKVKLKNRNLNIEIKKKKVNKWI